jgi:cAMP phosphodiesterase
LEIRVLGCYGGQLPGHDLTTLLVNRCVLLDAGTVTSALDAAEQQALQAAFISHPHRDPHKDHFFLADNIFDADGVRSLRVIAPPGVIMALRGNLLNNVVWPDFSALPTPERPVLKLEAIEPDEEVHVCGLSVTSVPMNHGESAVGYLVRGPEGSIIYSGDTGPTWAFWELANSQPDLKAVFIECSFPNRLARLAQDSAHLTPDMLAAELEKFQRPELPVHVFHMKPHFLEELAGQVAAIGRPGVSLLTQGQRLVF